MGDEQVNVGQGSSDVGVSESPRCGDMFDEGGEIMVEVVGSEVLVDGVGSAHKEGEFEAGKVRVLESAGACSNLTTSVDVLCKSDVSEVNNPAIDTMEFVFVENGEGKDEKIKDESVGDGGGAKDGFAREHNCSILKSVVGTVEAVGRESDKTCRLKDEASVVVVDRDGAVEGSKTECTIVAHIEKPQQDAVTDAGCLNGSEFRQADSSLSETPDVVAGLAIKNGKLEHYPVKAEITANGERADIMVMDEHAMCNVRFVYSEAGIDDVDEESHMYQCKEEQDYAEMPELSNCKVEKLESIDEFMRMEVTQPCVFPGITENFVLRTEGSLKINEYAERRSMIISAKLFSVDEMLLQLQALAHDPKNGHDFHYKIRGFFEGFRSSFTPPEMKIEDPTVREHFKDEGTNNSYWADKIVHDYPAVQLLHDHRTKAVHIRSITATEFANNVTPGHQSRKRFSNGDYLMAAVETDEDAKRRKQGELLPAELILSFAERKCLPSEINLNKMFRRFGPLMESETLVDHDSGQAKVVFKRGSDAEAALDSSKKFNIFEPVLVNYHINYSPVISVRISPVVLPQNHEETNLL